MKLLSTRCQSEIGISNDIEYYLADCGKKLKDPILVLGEAFSKCKYPRFAMTLRAPSAEVSPAMGFAGKTTPSTSPMPCNGMRRRRTT